MPPRGYRKEIHTGDMPITQKATIIGEDLSERGGEVVVAQHVIDKEYMDELAFNEEPVRIRLEPSTERNAPKAYPVWVNGKGAEVFQGGKWVEIKYIPVGIPVVIKRKYLAVLASAKFDTLSTDVGSAGESEIVRNEVVRQTSGVTNCTVIEDKNEAGHDWLSELRSRNF